MRNSTVQNGANDKTKYTKDINFNEKLIAVEYEDTEEVNRKLFEMFSDLIDNHLSNEKSGGN